MRVQRPQVLQRTDRKSTYWLADVSLDKEMLKSVIRKNGWSS